MKNVIKVTLFASLIIAMVLPFSGMMMAEAKMIDDVNMNVSDNIVEERSWGQEKHDIFKSFAEHEMPDNKWNKEMLKENIKNYNIETRIGHDVDGYELVALDTQIQKLQNNYNPSLAQEKLHEYILTVYDVPDNKKDIQNRIFEIAGQIPYGQVKQLVGSLNRMADMGIVSSDVHEIDVEFWNNIAVLSFCEFTSECPSGMITSANDKIHKTKTAKTIPIASYTSHYATIKVQYQSCETSRDTCYVFLGNGGSGYESIEFSGPGHVADWYLRSDMTNWSSAGGVVVVIGQVTNQVAGSAQLISDDDGYVTGTKYLYNPNARAESYPSITLTSYAQR